MSKIFIRVYCRLKPNFSDCQSGIYYSISPSNSGETDTLLIRAKPTEEFVNNKPESHTFIFKKIFDQNSSQEYIYSIVGSPVIKRVLKGYNGTIFAYGQSGSGKTYTISGVSFDESSEAIVHNSLIQIFEEIEEISGEEYEVDVSFMEIYNEVGRDLLKETNEKIIFQEDEDGEIQLKNLSLHNVKNYKQFLTLYRFGENNRSESDTLLNQYSSRSHCILTVHLTIRDPVLNGVRRSKLHLVDLAGSERLSTTSNSQTNTETRHINLSLHYLEQVIVALGEKHRQHIPYRNSMMTTVLRDSLGGNCLTAMIATLSMNENNLDESISTCRFAQRVALVKNEARLNIFDENIETDVLQNELHALKHQMSDSTLQKSISFSIKRMNNLSKEDSDECRNFIEQFIINNKFSCTSFIPIIRNPDKTRVCFEMMKKIIIDLQTKRRKAERQVHSMYERAIESRKNSSVNLQKNLRMNSKQQLLLSKNPSSTNTLATINTDLSHPKCKREDSKCSSDKQSCCQQICTTNEFSEKMNSLENQFKTFRKELKRLHDKEYNKLSTIHKLVTMSEIQGKDVFKKLSDVEIKTIVNEHRMRDYKKKSINTRSTYTGYVSPFCKSDILIASAARNIENSYKFHSISHISSNTCKDV